MPPESPFSFMLEDIKACMDRDPAASSIIDVLCCYPGLHALWAHRISHWLWLHQVKFIARLNSQLARTVTGVEIHPGASIGRRCFIDHGMSIVIGETTIIGNDVTLYQGVTLGGTGKEKGKRHPSIADGVTIGAGAIVLGNITIGAGSRIGAGSVVLQDIPEACTVVGVPGRVVLKDGVKVMVNDLKQLGDPILEQLEQLKQQVEALKQQLDPSHQQSPLALKSQHSLVAPDYCI